MKSRFLIAVICAVLSAETASAQLKLPAEPKNAALLYWQAFAQLQDYPTDKATAENNTAGYLCVSCDEGRFSQALRRSAPEGKSISETPTGGSIVLESC